MNILLIDLSYYNFYRYYATVSWYKRVYPEENLDDYTENVIFIQKFEKMFIENINKYKKKFNIDKLYFCRDCPRKNIWRMEYFSEYKSNRNSKEFKGGEIFKYSTEKILPKILDENNILLSIDKLEADDIIYLYSKYQNNQNITIIGSDHDLLQIISANPNIKLYEASLKHISDKAKESVDLHNFLKSVLGDPSDNIKKIEKGLGEKTALKLFHNKNLLDEKFKKNPELQKQYNLNRLLVDFSYIPKILENEFLTTYSHHL